MTGFGESGWPVFRLGQVVTIAREALQPADIVDGTQYVGLEDISGETGAVLPRRISAGELQSAKFAFSSAHLLYGKLRPNLRKVARPLEAGICSTDILPLLPSETADRDYLFHWLRSPEIVQAITSQTSGANLPRIAPRRLLELEVPLPPLAEQRRIAALLDRADAVRRKREESRRLVDELLRSVFLEMFGDPVRNENGWEVRTLSGRSSPLAEVKAGPFGSALKKETYTSAGYRVYGQEQVLAGSLETGAYYVNEATYRRLGSCAVQAGDLLVSLVGSFGKVLIVPEEHHPGIINPRLVRVRPNREFFNPQFLAAALQQSSVQERLKSMSHGGTMGILNAGQLKSLPVVVPPINLQRAYAERASGIEQLRNEMGAATASTCDLGAQIRNGLFGNTGLAYAQNSSGMAL